MQLVSKFFSELYFLVGEMAPYLLLGFLFAGLLKAYFPQDKVIKFMGKNRFTSVLNAALLGVPMPLCSCGVIPTGVSFYRNGATKGATTSFLISTPQTGVDSILATYSLLGLPFAIIRPIVALLTGVFGGLVSHRFDSEQHSEASAKPRKIVQESTDSKTPATLKSSKLGTIISYGFGELVEDIVKWLVIGLLAAAVLSVAIPESFFSRYIGNQYLEMGMILLASVPLYICATGSIPLAAVLLLKGISPGAALVLLMAGPATNVATMTVISKVMGRKALFIYLLTIVGGAYLFGTLVNNFLPANWFSITGIIEHQHGFMPEWFKIVSTMFLCLIIGIALYKKYLKPSKIDSSDQQMEHPKMMKLKVEGMTCNHCKATVENNVAQIEGVDRVTVDLATGSVSIDGTVDREIVDKTITSLGYKVV